MSTLPRRQQFYYDAVQPSLVGRAADQAFVVGPAGAAYRCDGLVWTEVRRGTSFDIENAVVLETGELVTVGDNGKVTQYDGMTWRTLREAEPVYVYDVFAESESRLMMSTYQGAFLLDGSSFVETTPPPTGGIYYLAGYSIDDVYGSYDRSILHFDGVEWSVDVDSLPTYNGPMWAGANGDMYAVGEQAVYRRQGGWRRIYDGAVQFSDVTGRGSRVVAIGQDPTVPTGVVAEFDGAWRTFAIHDNLFDVIIASDSRIMVAGGKGVYRQKGDTFEVVTPLSLVGGFANLFEIGGARFVAFGYEHLAYFDGTVWGLQPSGRRPDRLKQTLAGTIVGVSSYSNLVAAWEVTP
jgi:hypothetical protein